jgi:hypothetical protein
LTSDQPDEAHQQAQVVSKKVSSSLFKVEALTSDQPDEDELRRAEFERLVLQNPEKVDLIQIWCDYIQWIAQRFPGTDEVTKLLARACYALAGHERHKADVRHLRLWVRHAAHLSQPQSVFDFIEEHGIGILHALRYEASAASLEKQRRFPEAEAEYTLGLQRGAEPRDRLESRYEEFQHRMRKRAAREERQQKRDTQRHPLDDVSQTQTNQPPLAPFSCAASLAQQRQRCFRDSVAGGTMQGREEAQNQSEVTDEVSLAFALASSPSEPGQPRRCSWQRDVQDSCRRASVASTAGMTQELTTSGVRALLAGDSSVRLSRNSFAFDFEEQTCTMELAKREVLDILAHDPDHVCESSSLKPLVRVRDPTFGELTPSLRSDEKNIFQGSAFEIFEDGPADGEQDFECKSRSSLIPIWDDNEFDAAIGI